MFLLSSCAVKSARARKAQVGHTLRGQMTGSAEPHVIIHRIEPVKEWRGHTVAFPRHACPGRVDRRASPVRAYSHLCSRYRGSRRLCPNQLGRLPLPRQSGSRSNRLALAIAPGMPGSPGQSKRQSRSRPKSRGNPGRQRRLHLRRLRTTRHRRHYPPAARLRGQRRQILSAAGYRGVSQRRHCHALTDFDLAIKFDPYFSDAYVDRGIVFYRMGDVKRALADVAQAKPDR